MIRTLLPVAFLAAACSPGLATEPAAALYSVKDGLPERSLTELLARVGPATVNIKHPGGTGSGFLISEDGYIVTCAHVIEGENQGNITVSVYRDTPQGLEQTDYSKVRVITYSGMHDIAVLKIEPPEPTKFKWVPLGDSTALKHAEHVFALGSPLGLSRSASEGIVAVRNRANGNGFYVQTTAQLSPGNSGGPLFNMRGEVIGMNSAKLVRAGAEGISFATPSDVIKLVLRNREAFAFDPENPANGFRYLAPPAPAAGPGVKLAAPKLMKLGAECSLLRRADLDGDGRDDVVLANSAEARIELLYQRTPEELKKLAASAPPSDRERPVLDNAPFWRDHVVVGDDVFDLLPMDFDGDGLVDLVYTGRRTGLNVIFQTAPGKWEKSSRYDRYGVFPHEGTLCAADVDGDGKPDLVALLQGGRAIIFKGGQGKRDLGVPEGVGVANVGAQTLRVDDFDGDKRPDLLFISTGPDGARNLSLRLRSGDGFGPETAVTLGVGQVSLVPYGHAPGEFAGLGEKTGEVRLSRLDFRPPAADEREELQPQVVRPPVSGTASLLSTLADLTGTGRLDLVVADTEGSSLFAYSRLPDGRLGEDRAFPSLKSVSTLDTLRLPGDRADRVLVASVEEKIVGLSEYKNGRLTFPEPLPVANSPLAVAVIRLAGRDTRAVVCATRDGQRFNLETLAYDAAAKTWKSAVTKLGTLGRDPSGMLVRDLNGDGREDVLIFIPREPARILLQKADGTLEEAGAGDPVRKSQLDGVTREQVGFGDFDGDGKPDMLVAKPGQIRAYAVADDGALHMLDQANARNAADPLSVPAMVDMEGDGAPELVAYDSAAASLQVFEKSGALYRYRKSVFVGKNEPREIFAGAGRDPSLWISGARQIWHVPLAGKQWVADRVAVAPASVKDARFSALVPVRLTADGALNLAAIDGVNDTIEVFSGAGAKFSSAGAFRVFSDERLVSKGRDKKEPDVRSALGGDFDHDGRGDLVLLCHDRLLFYRREP